MECSKISSYTKNTQISDSLGLNLLLAFSGGLQDAYTYLMRGHVFANAQTGNVVLLSSHFIQKEFSAGFMYAVPLLSFALGILFSESIHLRFKNAKKMHWRQAILLLEIFVLFAVAFVPTHLHFIANALVSFSCALQVHAFRSVHGNAYASTMCIGNLRGAMEALADFAKSKKYDDMHRSLFYLLVIFFFALGSAFGAILCNHFFLRAVWGSCIILLICFFLMIDFSNNKNITMSSNK